MTVALLIYQGETVCDGTFKMECSLLVVSLAIVTSSASPLKFVKFLLTLRSLRLGNDVIRNAALWVPEVLSSLCYLSHFEALPGNRQTTFLPMSSWMSNFMTLPQQRSIS